LRVGASTLIALGAIAALVALGITDQVLPASDPHVAQVRPWIAARALGVAAYLLLCLEVSAGLLLSHPRMTAEWRRTRQVFPWHEMLSVFTGAFLALHVALLVLDPYAGVSLVGALVPGFSVYRPPAVAIGSVALYALIVTAVTAKWTRLLPSGWWLKVHRLAAVVFLLAWVHAVLAGSDNGSLLPLYLATGLPILAGVGHRLWSARVRPQRAAPSTGMRTTLATVRPVPAVAVLED
jgi:predicted ferric reductase